MTLADHIIFEDGEALVIDKPSGLPVDPPRNGGPSVTARLDELRLGFQRPPVVMHRLDRDTSGCLLLARNPKARSRFQQAFESGAVRKTYLAAVDGEPESDGGVIDLPIAKVSSATDGWRMVVDDKGKASVTHWRVIGRRDGQSLVELTPTTGRTHQLRVHATRGLGAAIVGDPLYGSSNEGAMLLHAWKLHVPRAGKAAIEAVARVPDRFGLWLDFIDEG
jgi:tRNA pseudouridine32 synthase/23S rRNA pseudouridine746 synthase